MKREENESYEEYRARRKKENDALKQKKRGVVVARTTAYSLKRQEQKFLVNGWSEQIPNFKRYMEIAEEVTKGRQ